MTWITAFFTEGFAPETGINPTLDIYRLSDNLAIVTGAAMSEVGGGYYKYDFSIYDPSEEYVVVADGGAPLSNMERYKYGGSAEALLEYILEDTSTGIPALIAELPTGCLVEQDVQDAMTAQGYTTGRAVLLDYLDAPISSITGSAPTVQQIWSELLPGAYSAGEAGYIVGTYLNTGVASVLAEVLALNNISIADVQTALTNQGYTTVRATFLDYLTTGTADILYLILGITGTATVIPEVITGTMTTEQLALLEELHFLQGLGGLEWPGTGTPMQVSSTERRVLGQLTQLIEADTPIVGTVRVTRTG